MKSTSTVTYKKLNRKKISNKKINIISSDEALKNIIPIEWSDSVQSGQKKVTIY
ncbi:MAG: hypothetical protein ACLRVD_07760 [Blautia caecimuris]